MAFRLGVRFDTKDFLRWTSALFRVSVVNFGQSKSVPRKCATEYVFMVRKNIMGFRSMRPYSPQYYEWKYQKMGLVGKGFWRLHDHLMNSLMVFQVQKEANESIAYMGGVPNGIFAMRISMFGGMQKAKEIAMYGKKAEELRPLFKPTAEQYIRAGYWESQLEGAKRKIKGAWR